MIIKTQGIILNNIDYRESDVICQIITKEYGLISLIVKGAKKINAKNRLCSMPFIKASFIFDYHDNKTMFQLQKADLIKNYYIDNSIEKISALNVIVDITKQFVHIEDDCSSIYEELENALDYISKYKSYYIVSLYMVKLAKIIGIGAYVDGCVICDNPKVVSFSSEKGGFLCQKHAYEYEYMPVEKLKLIRLINKMEWQHLEYLEEIEFNIQDFDLLAKFFFEHSDIKLKSFKFYRSLLSL